MTEYLLTFASLTRAQTGLKLLRGHRIAVQLRRTPKAAAVHGCGYALAVPEASLWPALETLRRRGAAYRKLFRLLPDGGVEEVLA